MSVLLFYVLSGTVNADLNIIANSLTFIPF